MNPSRDFVEGIAARLERLPITAYQRGIFFVIATAYFFDSMDLGAMTFVLGSIKMEFNLSAAEAGFLSSMSFVGMLFGASAAGMFADRFGRKVVFQSSMIVWGIGSIACGLASNILSLEVARVLLGIGMGMEFPIAQSLMSELIPTEKRGRYVAYLQGAWPVGFICVGLLSFAVLSVANWRWIFLIEGVAAVAVLAIRRYVPESPRWLASRGRLAEAERVTSEIESCVKARLRGGSLPPVRPLPPVEAGVTGFKVLWSRLYARRTAMAWGHWFFIMLGYYGMLTWLGALLQAKGFPVTKSVYYTVLISLAGIPGFLTAAKLVDVWGRKTTLSASLVASAIACYLYGTSSSQTELIVFGLAMQFCQFGMGSAMYAYVPELYPTRIRATGSGFASAAGRVGALLGPYIVGIVLPVTGQGGVFALGAGAFLAAAMLVLFLGIETKGKTLEEISDAIASEDPEIMPSGIVRTAP
jgi:putative MFS transporter